MNYYDEIKNILLGNEIYEKVKDYSKEKYRVIAYFETGRLLNEAGKHYGENIIEKYSKELIVEVGKKYNKRTLFRMKQFYNIFSNEKVSTAWTQLTWSHIRLLFSMDFASINYYIEIVVNNHISVRELETKIKSNEYERLDEKTKLKLINEENIVVNDFVKNPIVIKNTNNYEVINEKILKQLILEDLESFMRELGKGFSFIGSEYKIKIGDSYNYIDLLLFNYIYNCFIVVELKVTELRKEHIGQIEVYMNYIDKNVRNIYQDRTIGIVIVRKDNKFILEYSSDKRIFETTYQIS